MLEINDIFAYFERLIAENRLTGNRQELHHIQMAAGLLMKAAEAAEDKETARRFRILAAHAANKKEELDD